MQSHLTLHKAEAGLSGDLKGESYGWKLFHREDAQRLSATLSMRPSGSVQFIDIFWGSIWSLKILRADSANL